MGCLKSKHGRVFAYIVLTCLICNYNLVQTFDLWQGKDSVFGEQKGQSLRDFQGQGYMLKSKVKYSLKDSFVNGGTVFNKYIFLCQTQGWLCAYFEWSFSLYQIYFQ